MKESKCEFCMKECPKIKSVREKLKEAEERAEKTERDRDSAIELIGWIYYEACVSVEHNMRQYLDWLKDKIEEWRKMKEE